MNILILSVGTRNKIVQYFKKALAGKGSVMVADTSNLAPAADEADRFYLVPCISDPNYIDAVLDICKKENINGVLSLIDPELSILALNKDKFSEIGTSVIGSDYHLCEMSLDKFLMYRWLKEHGYKCAKTYNNFVDFKQSGMPYPVFIKPGRGSASISISRAETEEEARFLFEHGEDMIIQEYLNGHEIGADVYIDMISKEVVSIFTKRKIVMRAGETDKAVSIKDDKLFDLIERFVDEAGYTGQIDIDIFEIDGEYYISEVNPRFGGGYPHAYECGCDHMKMIVNNLEGLANKKHIGGYDEGIYMMKFNEIITKRLN